MTRFEKLCEFIKDKKDTVVKKGEVTCFIRSANVIFLHFNFNFDKNGLYVALHEVGHALQKHSYVIEAVNKFEKGKCSKKDVYRAQWFEEKDAWDRAEQLVEKLGFENFDWKAFNKKREEGLESYRKYDV